MTNGEVLRAATLHGAETVGYALVLGSDEPGKLADLIILRKDPLANIGNTNTLCFVVKNGAMLDAYSMDHIWLTARKLPEM